MEQIRIIPPSANACPVCAVRHDAKAPHDRDSLYYQYRFARKFHRLPTWEDAAAHCDEAVRARLAAEKAEEDADHEAGRLD